MTDALANRYEVLSSLGEGGMGKVLAVRDTVTDRQVALKLVRATGPAALQQLKHEFWIMTRLRHPGTVEVYDYGELEDGTPYFTMEVVPGAGLDELLPLPANKVKQIIEGLCRALAFIHDKGYVHGDLKPENARLTPDGQIKLMDFGLMERTGRSGGPIRGTLLYLAPEVARGGQVDRRADLYSLGALAYHLLTGNPPFAPQSPVELIKCHLDAPVPAIDPQLSAAEPELEGLIRRLMSKEPLRRYQSAAEVLVALGFEVDQVGGTVLAPTFIGREDELARFSAQLESSEGGLWSIVGEPGAGKTRLAQELLLAAQLADRATVQARCPEQSAPYAGLISALRSLLPMAKSLAPRVLEVHRSVLACLLPELEGGPAPESLEPAQEKMRLQAAIGEVLSAIVRARGLVIALDDAQWLDGPSRELLEYLARNNRQQPLWLVLVGGDAGESAERMELPNLSADQSVRMMASMLGTEALAAEFTVPVLEVSAGNPRYLHDLLHHVVEGGMLVRVGGRWQTEGGFNLAALPRTLHGIMGQKLDALGPEAMAVARVVAIARGAVPLSLLAGIEGLPTDEALFQALGELEGEGILELGPEGYLFCHHQLKAVALGEVSAQECRRLNGLLASGLMPLLEKQSEDPGLLNAVTDHLLESENPQLAIPYALRAGRRNQALFATAEARRYYTEGLVLLDGQDAPPLRLRLDYLLGLGDAERRLGDFPAARGTLTQAAELGAKLGTELQESQALTGLGKSLQAMTEYDPAIAALKRAAEIAERIGASEEHVRALTPLGRISYFRGEMPATIDAYRRALDVAREAHLPALLGECLAFLGFLYSTDPVRQEQGLAFLQESLTLKHNLGDKVGLNDTTMLLGNAYLALGRYGEAGESFMQCQQLNAEIGQQDEEIFSYLNLSIVALEMGDFAEALRLAELALTGALEIKSRFAEGVAISLQGIACVYLGHVGEGLEAVDRSLALARETSNRYMEVTVAVYRSEALILSGQIPLALEYAEEALAATVETGVRELIPQQEILLGQAQLWSGDRDAARALLVRARKTTSDSNARGVGIKALWGLALVAAHSKDFSSAQKLANEALADAEELEARYLCGMLHVFLGELQLVQDRRSLAIEHLRKAVVIAERSSSPLLHGRALNVLAEADSLKGESHRRQAKAIMETVLATVPAERRDDFERAWREPLVPRSGDRAIQGQSVEQRLSKLGAEISELLAYVRDREARWSNIETSQLRLEQLIDFALKTNQIHDLQRVLEMVMDLILEIAQAERGYLLLYRGLDLEVCQIRNFRQEHEDGDWLVSRSIADEVLRTEQPICLQDVLSDARFASSESVQALKVRTVLCVPLKIHNIVVGALYVDRQSIGNSFSEGDLDVVMSLAALAATAIENANLHQEWEDKSRKLEMLNTLARTMSTTLVLDEVLDLVVTSTLEITQAERGFLLLWEAERLVCRAAFDQAGAWLDREDVTISRSICDRVMASGEAICVEDAMQHEELSAQASILALNLRTVMCVPLVSKQNVLGVLYVDSQAIVNAFTDRDLELLQAIAHHATTSLENAHLYTQLSRRASELESLLTLYEEANLRASTDSLTDLHNRRYFQEQLSRDFSQAKRHRRFLSVIMLDIDHFKSFNDTFGHALGDQVLISVSGVLQQAVRLSDVVARYGGEEFIVSLPDTDLEGAEIVAERIRRSVSEIELLDPEGNALRQITVSLGISSLRLEDERIDELVERADRGLYVAKVKGRNQIQIIRD